MIAGPIEQRNPYNGSPPRPWLRLRLMDIDGTGEELELLADTGNPCAIIVSRSIMAKMSRRAAPDVNTNFGPLEGGWLHVAIREAGLDRELEAFGSDAVVASAQASSPDFAGLAGLLLLRLLEYGGDADWFWVRPAQNQP